MVKKLSLKKERNTGSAFFKMVFPVIFALQAIPVFAFQDAPSSSIGISGGPIFVIVAPSDSSDAVYVGTGVGIFKSVSGEDIWTPVNEGLTSKYVYDIATPPVTPTILYAAAKEGVYKSTDDGEKWTASGLKDYQIFSLAINPVTTTYLVAGTNEGVFTSINEGNAWTKEATGPLNVYDIAIDPDNLSTVYAGSFGEGIKKSTDFGLTWSKTGDGPEFVRHIAINPSSTNILYAGTNNGIYKSTDSGTSWSHISADFSDVPVYSIAILSSDPSTLYAATDKGAYKTTNSGSTWASIKSGIATDGTQGPFVREIVIDPGDSSTLYAGTYSGNIYDVDVYKSTNSGSSWTQMNRELSNTVVYAIAFDPDSAKDIVFAGTGRVGVLKSTNSGKSWNEASEGLTNYFVRELAVNPDSSNVYAGTSSGLFFSSDAGVEWKEASPSHEIYSIEINPHKPDNIYIGTNSGVFFSIDEGTNWSSLNEKLDNPYVYSIVFHPEEAEILYVGTNGGGVFKSTSEGESWESVNEGLDNLQIFSLAIASDSPYTLYAGTKDRGVYKSSDDGETWKTAGSDIDSLTINTIAINPDDSDFLYVGTKGKGFYRSTDEGQNWGVGSEGISDETVYDIALDPENSQTVFVALEGNVLIFTFNSPPNTPSSPSPSDGAVNQPVETTLSWAGIDPDAGDSLSYKVYFGTDENPKTNNPVEAATAEYDPGTLQLSRTYYWKVIAVDSYDNETDGDIWKFSTLISNPPLAPANPSPQDGSENQSIIITLSWTGGDPDNDTVTYDIYLGTQEAPRLVKENLEEPTYKPSRSLRPLTTYYWYIVSKDSNGLETVGAVWSFRTGLLPERCFAESILGNDGPKLHTLRSFRDKFLLKTKPGRELSRLYYLLSPVLVSILEQNPELKAEALELFEEIFPDIERAIKTGKIEISPKVLQKVQNLFNFCANKTEPSIKQLILTTMPKILNLSTSISKRNENNYKLH